MDLHFDNPVFLDGMNATTRRGRRWDRIVDRFPFPVDVKKSEEDDVLLRAEIVGKVVVPIGGLPQSILDLEQDDECSTREGVFNVMRRAYPDFKEGEVVTVLLFQFPTNQG